MLYMLLSGLAILIAVFCLGYFIEKRLYNKGICPKCGASLEYYGTDSQGGRGYVCRPCNYDTWVSYPFIEV